jgi:hypothetical protein
MKLRRATIWIGIVLTAIYPRPVTAEVVRVEIRQRGPFADGHAFGRSGPYEKIVGRLHLEVDPDEPANARIADLMLAPRNARGRVEFWSDFGLLAPADPRRGNRRLLYELVYVAKDPRVTGLGFAAVRDAVSFFRHQPTDGHGTANPLHGVIERAYIFGISQSGRFVNHFFYDDFNADSQQRTIFDGAISHVSGAGRGLFNHRFGMATLCATHHENRLTPSESFPFATVPQTDPLAGRSGDLLARLRARGAVPKIFFTQTSTEYWTRGASLLHTDVEGQHDVELDPNVRLYSVSGAQHLGGGPTDRGFCQNPRNPLHDRGPVLRALLVALDRWVSTGTRPPDSRYPRIAERTLVDLETFRKMFPRIPSVCLPSAYYMPFRLDFGPRWLTEGIADRVPPHVGPPYHTLVPAVDADGNEVAGIRLPDIAVPLATYTGWNLRAAQHGAEGMLAPYHGSYLAFARTRDERLKSGDPRPSVLEHYPTREIYLARITQAALELHAQGLLLEEDAIAILRTTANRQF